MGRALSENSMQFLWFLSNGQSWAGEKAQDILCMWIYLKICLSFRLECDNHKTDEDVDHEESKDDDVDEVEHEDNWTVAFFGPNISFVGVNGHIENPENWLIAHCSKKGQFGLTPASLQKWMQQKE